MILTPMASAMRARSPGSLVTTGAWWRTAVAMTIASTTSVVPSAAQAMPWSALSGLHGLACRQRQRTEGARVCARSVTAAGSLSVT